MINSPMHNLSIDSKINNLIFISSFTLNKIALNTNYEKHWFICKSFQNFIKKITDLIIGLANKIWNLKISNQIDKNRNKW